MVAATALSCCADDYVLAPRPGPTEVGSIYPFLLKQMGSPPTPTMRYQQVYNASLFTNVSPASIYVTTFEFRTEDAVIGWTVPNLQINLSTTTRSADNLSSIFIENVGPDDTRVFGPHSYTFPGGETNSPQTIFLDRGFKYNPQLGNLLMDVRVLDGSGFVDPDDHFASLRAYGSATDEVSRVWATNVAATVADVVDSVGLTTVIQLSPIPSPTNYTSNLGTATNYVVLKWRTQPPQFTLQRSTRLGPAAAWNNMNISGSSYFSNISYQGYYFPFNSAGPTNFFRLVGPGP